MLSSARNVIIPTPPQPMMLRSIQHVVKRTERHHPHPTPPQPMMLRSIQHVVNCTERHHPHPTPTHDVA